METTTKILRDIRLFLAIAIEDKTMEKWEWERVLSVLKYEKNRDIEKQANQTEA